MFKQFSKKINIPIRDIKQTIQPKQKFNYISKKFFFNRGFGNFSPINKYILGGFTVIYMFKFLLPERTYYKEFLYHRLALKHHRYQTILTTHFASLNFLDYILNLFVYGYIGSAFESMFGSHMYTKIIISSVIIGSAIMLAFHKIKLIIYYLGFISKIFCLIDK